MSQQTNEGSVTRQTIRARVVDALRRNGLALATVGVVVLLVVMFYFPVGAVLAEAFRPEGRLSLAAFRGVLTDPFYVGVLAGFFEAPLSIGRHLQAVAGFLAAGVGTLRVGPLAIPVWWPPAVRLGLFGFTAYQAALSTIASVLLGLPGAFVLSRFEFPGRRTLRSLTILPFVLPGIMVAIGFFAMFAEGGFFNDLLAALGFGRLQLVGTLELIVVAHAFYNAPLVTRVTTAAWEGVDARMTETARSLGAGPYRAFADVVLPQLVPAVLTGALLTYLFTFMTFPIVLALGGLQLATIEVWVYDRVSQLQFTDAATLATLETVISLALTYAYLRYEARTGGERTAANPPPRRTLVPTGEVDWRSIALRVAILAYGLVVAVVFLGPLVSMIVESFTVDGGFTLRHYAFLFQRQTQGATYQTKPLPAIYNSLLFAGATLVVALPMGVVVAVLSTDRGPGRTARWRTGAQSLAMAPLAVSGIVVGVGLLQALVFGIPIPVLGTRFQVVGPVAIVAAHAVAAYPFVVRTVAPMLDDLDRSMVESARALGASRVEALVQVELPLVYSGLLAGAAFAFAISIGEFDSTVILATGSDFYTMPVAVQRFLGRRTGPAVAMGTVLLAVTALSFVVVDRVGGRLEEL